MKAQQQEVSICETCIYAPECTHYKNSLAAQKPIWFCEDFDDRPQLQEVQNKEPHPEAQPAQSSSSVIEMIPGRMKGLCLNCDNRATCIFPIREGGVWYCEEYC